jgi:lipopolysaccharide export system protein LptC
MYAYPTPPPHTHTKQNKQKTNNKNNRKPEYTMYSFVLFCYDFKGEKY